MKMNGPTIRLNRKGRILRTSIPGPMDALRASITISIIGVNAIGNNADFWEIGKGNGAKKVCA